VLYEAMTIYSNSISATSNACCKRPPTPRLNRRSGLQLICSLLLLMLASCASKPVIKPSVEELQSRQQRQALANLLLERALRIAPSQADIYLGLARLRMDQSLPEEALAFVQRGLALQPQTEVKAQLQATGVIAKEAISNTSTPLGS